MTPVLHIGNRNYSSWSLRPWLALTWAGIAFETHAIALGGPGYGKRKAPAMLAVSPSGNVPALQLEAFTIVDSLAICEWAAESSLSLWPRDAMARAQARSAAAEMHSGFADLRRAMPCNIRRRTEPRMLDEAARADVDYLQRLWARHLSVFGGPYLFGNEPTIADAFYTPVATRLRTYAVAVDAVSQKYVDTLLSNEAFRTWEALAVSETWVMEHWDNA
jgi:glutathione S-transferase